MAIDKLIPQYLNSDTDQKLVKSVEMTDNLNVRVSNDAEGTEGVIKNVKGTDVVGRKTAADEYPVGENRVIGAASNESNKEVLFLLWNENDDHGIYRLDTTSGKYSKLFQDSVLNFKKYNHISCNTVVNEEGETLFYWTDGFNPPMKVNINRLIKSSYPSSFYNGTDYEKLLSLTVAKQPPLKAPSFNFVNNPDISKNNLYEKSFQFAYRYKYNDGELSALSPYSPLTASSSQFQDGLILKSTRDFFNQLDVFVRNTVADVEEIILYAKNSTLETFYEVGKVKNNNTSNPTKISFTDDKISAALSENDVNKNYDNVPQTAKAQAIVSNRLMYGNYKEGYENTELDVNLSPVHHEAENIYKITVSHDNLSDIVNQNDIFPEFNIDFSEVPASISANERVFLEFSIVADRLTVGERGLFGTYGELEVDIVHPDNDTIENLTLRAGNNATIKLSPQGIVVSKMFSFTQSITRADFIDVVSSYLASNYFDSIVSAPDKSYNYATINAVKNGGIYDNESAKTWYSGVSFYTFTEESKTTTSLTIALRFSGAEIFIKELEVKGGNWFTNIWTGFKPVDVVNSSSLVIGGQANYNKFSSNADAKETGLARYRDTIVAGNASFGGKTTGSKTFKSGSNHSFGVVYLDDRGRSSGVNKINDVFVDNISERDYKGRTEIDIRVKNKAPFWAKKWMPVYAGNSSFTDYLQYTTGEAYTNYESKEVQGSSLGERIFVSMSTLEGSETSFKEQTGADLEYKYFKGDALRILRYKNKSGTTVYPSDYVFNVVDYKYFSEDEAKLFLNRTGNSTSAGWFLILESEEHEGFSSNAVSANSDLWSSETVVEIHKPAKVVLEKVYYGLGKTYDVVNGRHEGDRDIYNQPSATVTIDSGGTATSADRLYVGDTLVVGSTTIIISKVSVELDGTYTYQYTGSVASQAQASYLIGNFQNGVATISQGDGYHRVRKIRISDDYNYSDLTKKLKENRFAYSGAYVEDRSISDFFSSKTYTKGKPYAYIPDSKTIHRRSSITYSDPFVIDSDTLNLSSFNLSLTNWMDLAVDYGQVHSLVNRGDSLTVIQESKASQITVNRNVIEYANGDKGVSISTNVLGAASYYAGDFGTSNPESVVERFGVVYYADVKAGKIIRLSTDGITPISDKGVESFIEGKFKSLLSVSDRVRVVGGFDADNNEYLISVEPVYNSTLEIGSDTNPVPVDATGEFTVNGITFTSSTVIWNAWGNIWNTYCGNWEDVGNGVVYVDSVFNPLSILVDSSYLGSTATINILVTNSAYGFSAIATLNLSTGVITMPATTCEGEQITIGTPVAKDSGFTIAYKHRAGVWGSKYSFVPTMYADINNELYSFYDTSSGTMWKHNVNDTRNNFYGTQYDSMIEVVSNRNPSMIKVFESIAVEGNGTWSSTLKTSEQSTTVGISDFDTREGHRYAMVPRDTEGSTEHQIYIGKVDSISSDKVTFTTPVNRLPFVVGDILRRASGASLIATGMQIDSITDRKTIQCTTAISNISTGDNVFVEHSSRVDGDPMRDVFLKIKLTSTDTTAFEVHAVSLSFDRSMLHNDRVN
jgi:hypothetical protein